MEVPSLDELCLARQSLQRSIESDAESDHIGMQLYSDDCYLQKVHYDSDLRADIQSVETLLREDLCHNAQRRPANVPLLHNVS